MKTSLVLASVGAVAAVGVVGYAAYFDYRRRNDPEFRKDLKKQKKRAARQRAAKERVEQEQLMAMLAEARALIDKAEYPAEPSERERFFMEMIAAAEVVESAVCFFKAMTLYRDQMELLMLLQRSVPENVMTLLYGLVGTEAEKRTNQYYAELTARLRGVNVVMQQADGDDATASNRAVLTAAQDFRKGDLIFMEEAAVATLHPSVITTSTRCHGCLSAMPSDVDPDSIFNCVDCAGQSCFCSAACMQRATPEWHKVLCPKSSENPAAQKLWDYCVEENRTYPLLVARFMAMMIWKQSLAELQRRQKGDTAEEATILPEWEHLERLRACQLPVDEQIKIETKLVCDALAYATPGAGEFITPERYAIIKATMLYNSYGLYEDGADVTDESTILSEPTRCAKSSASPFGAALFFVSSYIQHDAVANVELSFLCRDSKQPFIVAKAARDIAANEPLSTRYFAGKMEGKQGAIWSNANEALTEE